MFISCACRCCGAAIEEHFTITFAAGEEPSEGFLISHECPACKEPMILLVRDGLLGRIGIRPRRLWLRRLVQGLIAGLVMAALLAAIFFFSFEERTCAEAFRLLSGFALYTVPGGLLFALTLGGASISEWDFADHPVHPGGQMPRHTDTP